ncbi:MAG TPA: PIN domain-containing protein [Polyangiaceae bacterium]
MRSVFVDSSAWVAFFSSSDGQHADAHAAFARATRERRVLLTSSLVLAEVHRLFLYRTGIRAARAVLDRMTTSRDVRVEHATGALHASAMTFLDRLLDQPITYADAMSFAIMKAARCTAALAFDRHFAMAGFAMWRGGRP